MLSIVFFFSPYMRALRTIVTVAVSAGLLSFVRLLTAVDDNIFEFESESAADNADGCKACFIAPTADEEEVVDEAEFDREDEEAVDEEDAEAVDAADEDATDEEAADDEAADEETANEEAANAADEAAEEATDEEAVDEEDAPGWNSSVCGRRVCRVSSTRFATLSKFILFFSL
jgi:type IV secretory pathway VirB10-like protein